MEIKELITAYLQQAKNGASVENPKLDFKREWYKLNDPDGLGDFLVDTSAIANTFGLDGFVVIGYDEKKNLFYNSPFVSSGLKDSSQLMQIISRNVDPLFTLNSYEVIFEGNTLSVLHIPPSINKPHVLRNFQRKGKPDQHRIFVRKNTVNHTATRYDIELMYYDRKNIIPDYEMFAAFNTYELKQNANASDHLTIPIDLENTGRRPVSLIKLSFELKLYEDARKSEILSLVSADLYVKKPIIVLPNCIFNSIIYFQLKPHPEAKAIEKILTNRHVIKASAITALTSTGFTVSIPINLTHMV